jgi:hypothetical protein
LVCQVSWKDLHMRVAIYMVTGLYPEHLELMPLNGNKITRLPVSIAGLALTTWLLPMELQVVI